MADFFFYGTLCYPPLLAAVLGREAETLPAILPDHASFWAAGHAFPMIEARPGAVAPGVLLCGVTATEAARLDYYEGGFAYATHEVHAEAGGRACRARVYFPEPGAFQPGAAWDLNAWAERMGAAAALAAHRFMAGFGVVPQAEARRRYPGLLISAAAEVRARTAAPATVRRTAGPEDVAVVARREPYAAFFSVEEIDLRHRRFDGEMSAEMRRAVFVTGDAAVVLPYDPVRDRVLLIEQFRAGPFGRGDANPWMLEPIAGRIDPGETPQDAARREAAEEAGVELSQMLPVAAYYPSPGTMAEYLYSYVGLADLADPAPRFGGLAEEHEDIRVHVLSFARLMDLVASGEAQIGPILILAAWLSANRDRLRREAGSI